MLLIKTLNRCCPEVLLKTYFYTWCLIVFVSISKQVNVFCMLNNTYHNHIHTSGLCINGSKSCSHQMPDFNTTNETCTMIFHPKEDPVCSNKNFNEGDVDLEEEQGQVLLQTYAYRQFNVNQGPAFNVSFKNMNWEKVYMRFINNRKERPSLCREFQVKSEIPSSFTLFFDCLWDNQIEQMTYHFEYRAFTPSGDSFTYKYLFIVPNGDQIDYKTPLRNWTIFMIVDVTRQPEKLDLRLQVAPESLGIRGYRVEVVKTLKDDEWVVKKKDLYPEPGQEELRFPFDTYSKFGKYKFRATPIHDNCTSREPCAVSSTPEILIVEMAEPKFLTSVVIIVILIPILLMAYFIWKRNCPDPNKDEVAVGPPKLLMIYKPVSLKHVQTMIELNKYFNRVCGLRALIDELGIPESRTKDPLQWYIESFNEANYVAIFASPDSTPSDKEEVKRFSRYQHIEMTAHNQLSNRLCSTETKCKFFSISIPGSNWETLPPAAAALKRYILPRDLDPLLVLVGASPQCDGGLGFNQTLDLAAKTVEAKAGPIILPPPIHPVPSEVHPIAEEDEEDDGRASLCCDPSLSVSDLELVSSRQHFSDTDSTTGIDHLSLLDYIELGRGNSIILSGESELEPMLS